MESGFLGFVTPEFVMNILVASGACAWLSSVLKSTSNNQAIQFLLDLLNLIGGNIFKGKNADDPR